MTQKYRMRRSVKAWVFRKNLNNGKSYNNREWNILAFRGQGRIEVHSSLVVSLLVLRTAGSHRSLTSHWSLRVFPPLG